MAWCQCLFIHHTATTETYSFPYTTLFRSPVGEPGEVWTAAPSIIEGYWNAPELSADKIRDGWLLTGDLGHVDERSEEHTSELQSPVHLVCRLLLEKKKVQLSIVVILQAEA